ncbi:MAG: hypothetical protein ABSE70_05150 [Candidatus Limnocylindrales bacterium]
MPLTPRLARIIAAMIDAKLDAEARAGVAPSGRMTRARRPTESLRDPVGRRQRDPP